MAQALFEGELKTRVQPELKSRLESEAARRQVKSSHIVREALTEYLDKVAPVTKSKAKR